MDSCGKHPHEIGVAICRRCGDAWCRDCLVYAFGPKKPPFCMGCAMVAGGVRTASTRPALSRRELKARMKSAKVEAKQAAERPAAAAPPDAADGEVDVAAEPVHAAAEPGGGTDWATPWWEDREPTLAD